MQKGEDGDERVRAGCDRKSPQGHAEEHGLAGRRQPLGILGCQVDHQADHRHRLVVEPPNAEPAHFDQSRQRR